MKHFKMKEEKKIKSRKILLAVMIFSAIFVLPLTSAITWSEEQQRDFRIFPDNTVCGRDAPVGWDLLSNGDVARIPYYDYPFDLGGETIGCYIGDIDKECCPLELGYLCNRETSMCEPGDITFCSNLTEDECSDHEAIAENEIEQQGERGCGYWGACGADGRDDYQLKITGCRCIWDEENSRCVARKNETWAGIECGNDREMAAVCYVYTTQESECSAGYMTVSWDGYYVNINGNAIDCSSDASVCDNILPAGGEGARCIEGKCRSENCDSGSGDIPCLSGVLLSFFNVVSLIIAVLIIIIFYLIVIKKKRSFSRRKSRKK